MFFSMFFLNFRLPTELKNLKNYRIAVPIFSFTVLIVVLQVPPVYSQKKLYSCLSSTFCNFDLPGFDHSNFARFHAKYDVCDIPVKVAYKF